MVQRIISITSKAHFNLIQLETKTDLSGVVAFPYEEILLESICTDEQKTRSFFNKSLIHQIETTVRVWNKLIERVRISY